MPVALNHGEIDFRALERMGANVGQGMQNRRLRGAIGPNGEIDFKALWEADPLTALKYKMEQDEAKALAGYRGSVVADKAAPSLDERIYNDWQASQSPSYLGPTDTTEAAVAAEEAEANSPTGVPGISYTRPSGFSDPNAPKVVQDKMGSNRFIESEKNIGKAEGDRTAFRAALKEAGPEVDQIVKQMTDLTAYADDGTFRNALGAWQGTPDPDDWRESLTSGAAQTFGGIANYLEKGAEHGFVKPGGDIKQPSELPGGYTTTLRSQVLATQATLVNVMQRLLRVPGIGAQSDAELKQIILQSGELSKAETKEEFHTRLAGLLGRLKALGFDVKIPSLGQVAGGPSDTKTAERLTPETAPVAPVQGSMAPTQQEEPLVPGATPDPAGSYFKAPTGSGSAAIQNIKRAVAEGKMTRKQAIAIINANKDKWGVEVDESR
jgi:hypothetical protein